MDDSVNEWSVHILLTFKSVKLMWYCYIILYRLSVNMKETKEERNR